MNEYLSKVNFLIVDDHLFTLKLIRDVLATFGAKNIEIARDGTEALSVMKQFHPDVAIVDWLMSPMDGIAFTLHVRRSQKSPNIFLPIIMMTGKSERRQVIEAREAGVNEYVIKPLTAKALMSRIQAVIERPRRFVRVGEYFGPDRRRQDKVFDGNDKRGTGQTATEKAAAGARTMKQDEINRLFNPDEDPSKKD